MTNRAAVLTLALALAPSAARAEFDDPRGRIESDEGFAFELRLGQYQPDQGDIGPAFTRSFGDDHGPMLGAEVDFLPLRIPYVGLVGGGIGWGWVRYRGRTRDSGGNPTDERTKLVLHPVAGLAVLRIDVLAREAGVPIYLTGKVGLDIIRWASEDGGRRQGDGVSLGVRWGGQIALELDFLDRVAARTLDEEWGINHSFLFFELMGSTASSSLPVGDSFTWQAGLGFIF